MVQIQQQEETEEDETKASEYNFNNNLKIKRFEEINTAAGRHRPSKSGENRGKLAKGGEV